MAKQLNTPCIGSFMRVRRIMYLFLECGSRLFALQFFSKFLKIQALRVILEGYFAVNRTWPTRYSVFEPCRIVCLQAPVYVTELI